MCGIVLLHGPDAHARLPECLRRLKHRGPDDDDIWTGDDIVGSGIRGQVVGYLRRDGRSEREELLAMWRQRFPFDASNAYFHRYSVFDEAIDRRGTTHR